MKEGVKDVMKEKGGETRMSTEDEIIDEINALSALLADADGEDAAFINGEIAAYRMLL